MLMGVSALNWVMLGCQSIKGTVASSMLSHGTWVFHDAKSVNEEFIWASHSNKEFTATGLWFHGGPRLEAL